jgi:uncharacterized membrane-anchored protein YjiN (DUF445 family)
MQPARRVLPDVPGPQQPPVEARPNRVGTVSLLVAVAGVVVCRVALRMEPLGEAPWLRIAAGGFEAALIGALADWFAVTALFRHPLGLPIPHTAVIPNRRAKLIAGIVSMIENDWLSPEVIGARLERIAPSTLLTDWLRDPVHLERLGAPLRDVLRAIARLLTEGEAAAFLERSLDRQLRDLPLDATAGRWLGRALESPDAGVALETLAISLANLADRPGTAAELTWWIERSARTLREGGRRVVPFFLRRKVVQRSIVEAACRYASAELRSAAHDPDHPLRRRLREAAADFARRLEAGEPAAREQVARLHAALVESLEAGPLARALLARLRALLEEELADPASALSELVDRTLRTGILELFEEPGRRARFDEWVRARARELLERHHHQIGLTVRESLEALDTGTLVAQLEARVGNDLQFIRLNGAVVGGLIGVLIALAHWITGNAG